MDFWDRDDLFFRSSGLQIVILLLYAYISISGCATCDILVYFIIDIHTFYRHYVNAILIYFLCNRNMNLTIKHYRHWVPSSSGPRPMMLFCLRRKPQVWAIMDNWLTNCSCSWKYVDCTTPFVFLMTKGKRNFCFRSSAYQKPVRRKLW